MRPEIDSFVASHEGGFEAVDDGTVGITISAFDAKLDATRRNVTFVVQLEMRRRWWKSGKGWIRGGRGGAGGGSGCGRGGGGRVAGRS